MIPKADQLTIRCRFLDACMLAPIKGRADAVITARRVLLYLCARMHLKETEPQKYLSAWPSHSRMCAELRLPLRTLYRALARLERQGFIVTESRHTRWRKYTVVMGLNGRPVLDVRNAT